MAEEQSQGNIKQELNSANIGLNLDNTLNQIKQGTLTYALNAALENFDASSVNYQNEQGNELCVKFPEEYVLIGTHFINEQSKHIFFLTNPSTGDSEIGYMDNNDCIYNTLVNALCLNFNIDHPIHKTVHRITNCTTEIYWTDGFNPRRYLDINDIPYMLESGSPLCDPIFSDQLDCNQLKLQPNFNIPNLYIKDITTGGSLLAGTYQFAAQYADASGNPFTSYYSVTNPTPIADPQIATVNFNYVVGKSVVVTIDNLDSSGQFQYFNLAVIKTVNSITSVELIGTYFIDNTSLNITYTGQINDDIRLSINDIFEKFPYYDVAEDLTSVQDVLVWDGLASIDRINYQSIASKIKLSWETYEIPSTENYTNELNATNLRGYLRDEVYAFEIVFLLKNGKQTDGFHIPGRISNPDDLIPVPTTNPDFIGEPEEGTNTSHYWKIYNTASVVGDASGESIGNATPYKYGNFAYWESEETYPCNIDVWGDLAGEPIRHHKFPDVLVSPITKPVIAYSGGGLVSQNNYVYPIGVSINITQINVLIDESVLTDDQKADIVGFKIVRGDRGTNKSIVAKGILRNINSYRNGGNEFYYPNYPYNDLSDDVFLDESNAAIAELNVPSVINITSLSPDINDPAAPPYAEISYGDPVTGTTVTEQFTTLGERTWCSFGANPIIIHGGGTVKDGNYQNWRFASHGTLCPGYDVQWTDREGNQRHAYIYRNVEYGEVRIGTQPGCYNGDCDGCGYDIDYQSTTYAADQCTKAPGPQPGSSDPEKANLKYRQIFNSPETSYGQPYLGNILKLESIMFGKGRAHFVPVRNNAKYRLLTKEAQEDAYNSSNTIAGGDATGLFTAYQAYLQIYINGITRRNYAYSFNSIASYDYTEKITNSGNKQRELDIKRYLIPGVQNVGDDNNINNYQRESSVYLKTDAAKTAFSFASDNIDPSLKEKSRFTISQKRICSSCETEQDINVVSYYASLKNIFVNQWGQIYSYDTIDTGFQRMFNSNLNNPDVIFGGDTFIGRHTFKTKVPFFVDNRVNAPDDSDVFYDEIQNIAYPKYWHSARSILSNIGGMINLISYKAHEFDCPNEPLPETGSGRTFYNGYFYLFAYGIPNFYCESSYNLDLRQAFNTKEGDFWPHISSGIPDDWLQESFVSITNDNTYTYNPTFSKQNKENTFTHLPADYNGAPCYTYYPFRAVYSDTQNTDADNRVNSWLTYRATSYYDFPQNYGALISLDGIQNKAVLARFENKTLMYNNLLTIDTSNPQAAYVGNPNMFKGAPPIDFAETDLGYVGSQNKMLLKIPQGQITVDAKRGQVFLIQGTAVEDLSAFGSGMNRFFTDHLAFEILRYFPDHTEVINNKKVLIKGVDTDNNFNGIGLHGVYDSKFDRVILTKLDYIPLSEDIKYDPTTKDFYIETPIGDDIYSRTVISLKDPDYFCNKSWTLSFNVNTKSWVSFHSYIPNWYIAENNFFYSGINGCCDEFDFVAGQIVDTPSTTTTTTMFVPTTTTTSTTVISTCAVIGVVRATDCTLEGIGIITTPPIPPPCQRPAGLQTTLFITGYDIVNPPSTVVSTGSQIDACAAIAYLFSTPAAERIITSISGQFSSITVNQTIYDGTTGTDCTVIADGWYFTNQTAGYGNVFNVVGGVITQIVNCNLTTTTTAIPCYSFTITKTTVGVVTVTFTDCSGVTQTRNVGLAEGGFSTQTFCARSVVTPTPAGVSLTNNGLC